MNPSISTIQDFKFCPLNYRLKHVIGLRKIEDESAEHHLRFGSAMHAAMEVIYKAKMSGEHRVSTGTMKAAKSAFLSLYPRQLDPTDNAKTRETGQFAIESYVRHYGLEDQRKWRVLAVESPETYDSGFIVHLDMVAENLEHGGIYGFDFKHTKKKLDYMFWTRYEPNSQIARYTDYITDRYGSCDGFYIRATQFGYRSRVYKGLPAGYYVNHEAQLFNVNADKIRLERQSTARWMTLIEQAEQDDAWPMNTDSCQWCSYRPVCMAGWVWPEDRELITCQYRQICGEMTETLRPCVLDRNHDGQHSDRVEQEAETEMQITVEV